MSAGDGETTGLSVVVPAFNEERRLARSLPCLVAGIAERADGGEVIVVDDGSTDGTAAVARRFTGDGVRLLSFERNRGKGAALRAGVLDSAGELILLTDADLSTPMGELARLEPVLEDAHVAIGSRAVADSRLVRRQPPHRLLMGWIFRSVARAAGIGDIRDSQCGFKLLRGDVARDLFADMITDGFAFDVELLWLARRRGLTVREIGVTWEDSDTSRVRWWLDPWRMLAEIARFRRHHLRREGRTAARSG